MNKFYNRFSLNEINSQRVIDALSRRIDDIPENFSWNFSPNSKFNKKKIRKFKDIHLGDRCFIIGNGPSLTKTKLFKLRKEISFGLNRIYINFDNMGFKTNYFVAINELVIEQFHQDILRLSMPKFLNWNRRSHFLTSDKNAHFLKINYQLKTNFGIDITKSISGGGTVTFATMQLAYYMGFKTVILIGIDHKFTEEGIPNTTEKRIAEKDPNHFHPNYFPKGSLWQLPDLKYSEYSYSLAKKAFENDGREILDATIGGNCPIFKKIDFDQLFS
ncbi:MAG: DUF115 domain-containing protein [Anaerolineaceae bacterium]|nr:DUF115 domain-containing protein [Anaerolineaceae bacterium]